MTSNIVCQARLHALGAALKNLASDTSLPNISRVTIYLEMDFFMSGATRGHCARYRWDTILESLRTLLSSGKIKRFELRMSEPGRDTIRTKEIQETISKMVGKTAQVEGRGCTKCLTYISGKSWFQQTDFSLV